MLSFRCPYATCPGPDFWLPIVAYSCLAGGGQSRQLPEGQGQNPAAGPSRVDSSATLPVRNIFLYADARA